MLPCLLFDISLIYGLYFCSSQEAWEFFRAGKNCDGYFTNDHLVIQVQRAIKIFDERFGNNAVALFAFDNATTHQKRAPDALSARKMPKGRGWSRKELLMRDGKFNNVSQPLYFKDPHSGELIFKGMQCILEERGLFIAANLRAECPGFKCPNPKDPNAMCCCQRVLFNQPDFQAQKSHLEEVITDAGHLVIFYPKFHCELNFIEMVWGAAKQKYCLLPLFTGEQQMQHFVKDSLLSVTLQSTRR